jgi:hypothetical protein
VTIAKNEALAHRFHMDIFTTACRNVIFGLAAQQSGELPMRRRFLEESGQDLYGTPLGSWY